MTTLRQQLLVATALTLWSYLTHVVWGIGPMVGLPALPWQDFVLLTFPGLWLGYVLVLRGVNYGIKQNEAKRVKEVEMSSEWTIDSW